MNWFGSKKSPKPSPLAPSDATVTDTSPPKTVEIEPPTAPSAEMKTEQIEPIAQARVETHPTPDEALAALKAGNAAFLQGQLTLGGIRPADLEPLQVGQHPIATVVGCADSRVPPDILFNQGFGRLFSIRVAGNTVSATGLASIVYATKHLNCPLVVVMGHTGCGAVGAAEAVIDGKIDLDPSLEAMIVPIIPPVLAARRDGTDPVAMNARWVAQKLGSADASIADAIAAGRLKIVAAVKHLDTGRVEFIDPQPVHTSGSDAEG